jgi:hypothetical protein
MRRFTMRPVLTRVAALAVLLQCSAGVSAAAPTEEELHGFTTVFIALHKNIRPKANTGAQQRPAAEIIAEQGWTLDRYNSVASAVNSDSELFARFKTQLAAGSCSGATHSPPQPCD